MFSVHLGPPSLPSSLPPSLPVAREDLPYTPLKVKVASSLNSLLARLRVQEEEEKGKDKAAEKETGTFPSQPPWYTVLYVL